MRIYFIVLAKIVFCSFVIHEVFTQQNPQQFIHLEYMLRTSPDKDALTATCTTYLYAHIYMLNANDGLVHAFCIEGVIHLDIIFNTSTMKTLHESS